MVGCRCGIEEQSLHSSGQEATYYLKLSVCGCPVTFPSGLGMRVAYKQAEADTKLQVSSEVQTLRANIPISS